MKYRKETLEELDLTVRTYNCLKRAGINTVTDLTARSLFGLAEIKGMNTFSHNEIEEKLRELGLKLRPFNSAVRACPHNWPDCSLCVNLKACKAGTYEPEPEPEPLPELEENELTTDIGIPIQPLTPSKRETWAERLSKMSEEERWREYYKYHPPDLLSKEPYKCMPGGMSPGGGSRAGRAKKSNKGTKIPIEPWTSNT